MFKKCFPTPSSLNRIKHKGTRDRDKKRKGGKWKEKKKGKHTNRKQVTKATDSSWKPHPVSYIFLNIIQLHNFIWDDIFDNLLLHCIISLYPPYLQNIKMIKDQQLSHLYND